ncbi:hypothetical protein HY969_02600 [Candidatus Kaiserbacteria bacterium]|nr:hypothetical protein [Candidatus Kaiserbacteria bacterium]
MWQDWIISVVQWGFILANVPTILDKHQKPALLTSIASAAGLYIFTATYITLGLWAAAASSFILATEWALLAYQRWQLDKSNSS